MYDIRRMLSASFILAGLLVNPGHSDSAAMTSEIIELNSLVNIYGPVFFDHVMHMEVAACATCHHHTTGAGMTAGATGKCGACHTESCTTCMVACKACHTGSSESAAKLRESHEIQLYHYDATGLKRAYHDVCLGCHREMEAAAGCADCHLKIE